MSRDQGTGGGISSSRSQISVISLIVAGNFRLSQLFGAKLTLAVVRVSGLALEHGVGRVGGAAPRWRTP